MLSIRCIGGSQERPCTVAESEIAMNEALKPPIQTWDALYKSYKLHGNCDDGIMGENYSESVARILADHWDTLPRFVQLAAKHAAFRAFVIRHLDATLNQEDVVKIKNSAQTHCPSGLRTTCNYLVKQADVALNDYASQ